MARKMRTTSTSATTPGLKAGAVSRLDLCPIVEDTGTMVHQVRHQAMNTIDMDPTARDLVARLLHPAMSMVDMADLGRMVRRHRTAMNTADMVLTALDLVDPPLPQVTSTVDLDPMVRLHHTVTDMANVDLTVVDHPLHLATTMTMT